MGMQKMFTRTAEFSKMLVEVEPLLYVTSVVQKSFIVVNEDGTEGELND